ncbi:SBBP repeat-containing protein [candidate division KSB1 bacterium]|nr:SBBP repeat-containing protein [candidate division KSB1 bacterium]
MKTIITMLSVLTCCSQIYSQEFKWADVVFLTGKAQETYDDEIYMTTDVQGNMYITGKFTGEVVVTCKYTEVSDEGQQKVTTSIPLTSNGDFDIFLAKYNANGVLEWAISHGGPGMDIGKAVACNSTGDVIVTGQFEGTIDFGGSALSSSRKNNIFVAMYDSEGNLKWAQRAGGISKQPAVDTGTGIAVDASDNIFVTGSFYGADDSGNYSAPGKASFGDFQVTNAAQSTNSFVTKYTNDGNVQWVQTIAHYGQGGSKGICLDANGNSYITGVCSATFVCGGQVMNSNGISDIYVAKFNADGSNGWFKQFGSGEKFNPVNAAKYKDPFEYGTGICSDADGNIYVTGQFSDKCKFGNVELKTKSGASIFVLKMTGDGDVVWAKETGEKLISLSRAIVFDGKEAVFITGINSKYGGVDVENDGYFKSVTGRGIGFVEKYNISDGKLVWGGGAGSYGMSLAHDPQHNIYLVGSFANQVKFDDDSRLDIKVKIDEEYKRGFFTSDKKITTYKAGTALYMVKIAN